MKDVSPVCACDTLLSHTKCQYLKTKNSTTDCTVLDIKIMVY